MELNYKTCRLTNTVRISFMICSLQMKDIPGESIGLKFIPSQSELFWIILISVSERMRIIPKQSEKRFLFRLIKNCQKSIRTNPINFETSIRMNPNQSGTKFLISINTSSDWSKPNFQSESIRIIPTLDFSD